MYESLTCIALRTTKYDDSHSIVTAWSDCHGRLSLRIPAGAGRGASRMRALTMPLSVFAGEVDIRPGRSIHSIRDMRPVVVASSTATDPAKIVVATFISELLTAVLREDMPDTALSTFLIEAIAALNDINTPIGVANFPILFMWRLSHFLGIQPDTHSWQRGDYLDLRDGIFRHSRPTHPQHLAPDATAFINILDRLNYTNCRRLPLPRTLRRQALDTLIQYYNLHHTPTGALHSLPIISSLF